jgi:hypothetical protein
MRINFSRYHSLTWLAALALLALCWEQPQLRAQGISAFFLSAPSVGLLRDEALRFTLINPGAPELQSGREGVRAKVKLFDAQGRVIAESAETTIPAGGFSSFNFKRNDIALAGDPATGELQVRAVCAVKLPAPVKTIDGFKDSLEIVNNRTCNGTIGDIRTVISASAAYASANAGLPE